MNYMDHIPPHFHAIYNEYEIIVNIDDGETKGVMPARALRIVLEWWELNKDALGKITHGVAIREKRTAKVNEYGHVENHHGRIY